MGRCICAFFTLFDENRQQGQSMRRTRNRAAYAAAAGPSSSVNENPEHSFYPAAFVPRATQVSPSDHGDETSNGPIGLPNATRTVSPDPNFIGTGFIGTGAAMRAIQTQIDRVAPSDAPVFVTGESGTGKELCAQSVHRNSPRAGRPFVALNASAIPRDLIESEMFGHRRGAFTGAVSDHDGAARQADGGTLFLDEICEMDAGLQAKLLRFLQTGVIRPLGATRDAPVDVRIVCATNRDPLAEIAAGRFREDLYYRLHVLPLHLPPLRERAEDILPLAEHFLGQFSATEGRNFAGFEPHAAALLSRYDWPGNIRQLENTIRRIVVMHDGPCVTASMIPLALAHSGSSAGTSHRHAPAEAAATSARMQGPAPAPSSPSIAPFWVQEKRIIEDAIRQYGGHVGRAAVALELSPSTIYRKKQLWEQAASTTDQPDTVARAEDDIPITPRRSTAA
jgi:two-component system repressor protein LuxO